MVCWCPVVTDIVRGRCVLHIMSQEDYIMLSYQFGHCVSLVLCHLLIGTAHIHCSMTL